jgi:transcription elongation factor Elf1
LGRRRRKIVKIPRKKLPTIYLCPKCGEESVKITIEKANSHAIVRCGNADCRLEATVPIALAEQPIDAYCRFTDLYYAGKL